MGVPNPMEGVELALLIVVSASMAVGVGIGWLIWG